VQPYRRLVVFSAPQILPKNVPWLEADSTVFLIVELLAERYVI
jgi:hypothetical protein